jgi:predicted nucleotidyltransferase
MHHLEVPEDQVVRFGEEAAERLVSILGEALVGAYFVGSVALDDYERGRSDIDIAAVSARALSWDEKSKVVRALSHPHLLGPARGVEFVLYRRSGVEPATKEGAFEINLDTGPGIRNHLGFDPDQEPSCFFVLDRAIAHERGVRITGPPASDLFAPMPRPWVLDALSESIAWHRAYRGLEFNSVLNACRAWLYAEVGVLGSKGYGASWAIQRWGEPSVVQDALHQRQDKGPAPDEARIVALLDHVDAVIDRQRHRIICNPTEPSGGSR